MFTYTWDDTAGIAARYCLNISYANGTPYNSSCSLADTGSLNHTFTQNNGSFIAQGFINIGGNELLVEEKSITLGGLWRALGVPLSNILMFLVFVTLTLIGISVSAKAGIIMGVVGIITFFLMGLLPVGISAVIGIGIVGITLIVLMRERFGTP